MSLFSFLFSDKNESIPLIMSVHYYIDYNRVECYDFVNSKINSISGILDSRIFDLISRNCRTEIDAKNNQMHTQFFSWSDSTLKYIAYYEPIDNYLLNLEIWKIGQGISKTVFFDSFRLEEGKQVDMRSEHLLSLKKNLAELKIKVSKVITGLNEKDGRFTEKDVKSIDELFKDKRLHILPLIKGNNLFRSRIYIRQVRKSTMYERDEIQHYINCLALFLVECSM